MNRILALCFLVLTAFSARAQAPVDFLKTEYVICSGGPALRQYEEYRVPLDRHDRYWGNFTKASSMRMKQVREQYGPRLNITWLIYRPAYEKRAVEDSTSSTVQYRCTFGEIEELAAKYGAKIVWFSSTPQFISFMNRHTNFKMCGFEYFGHSNKYCFLFDYSGQILGASACYLHQKHLSQLNRGIFTQDAMVRSWGCHTGESMSAVWNKYTGHPMWGATGKTDFSAIKDNVTLPTINGGRWTQ